MNKRILMLCFVLIALSSMAFVYVSMTQSDDSDEVVTVKLDNEFEIYYKVDNRWGGITKAELIEKVFISEVLSDDGRYTGLCLKNATISILHNDKDVRDIKRYEMSQSNQFNDAQLNLLESCDYSTNLRFTALNTWTDTQTGLERQDSLLRYMTIIPEKEAEYEGGTDALIGYLKEATKELTTDLTRDKLQPGKFHFTITREGTISNVNMESSSGYPEIDNELMQILSSLPHKWSPAENSSGEKVNQDLVFSFGIQGC